MNFNWKIECWPENNDVEYWLKKLTKEEFKAVSKELTMLEMAGNQLKMPHSKALGSKLFELRERRYALRIYYTFYEKRIIILLAAGNKATQKKDIDAARKRLEKLIKTGVTL